METGGLEEYARTLDLSLDEVVALLESVFAGEVAPESGDETSTPG